MACIVMSMSNDANNPPGLADRSTYLAALSSAMSVAWPANRAITIVCHGHSVPTGYFVTPVVDTFNSYPHLLHKGLKQRFPWAVINVIVTGIGGENSESGAQRFTDQVLNHRPDLITMDYSLNDRGIGLVRAEVAWTTMITAARMRNIPMLLLTPTPDQASRFDDVADALNLHAHQVRVLAARHRLGLVDSLAAFATRVSQGTPLADLMSQSNHPNRAGHDLVTEGLLSWFP
jgi:lysophospholipase L1-like esterase